MDTQHDYPVWPFWIEDHHLLPKEGDIFVVKYITPGVLDMESGQLITVVELEPKQQPKGEEA
jgi:hypothetical protein